MNGQIRKKVIMGQNIGFNEFVEHLTKNGKIA